MTDTASYADFSIKATCPNPGPTEQTLKNLGAHFVGEDHQTDTYFRVPLGKMKLREGNIERLLTHYLREDAGGKMKTTVFLYEKDPAPETIRKHTEALEKVGQVIKARRIYFIDNVKFHLDRFDDGRTFVEIEAIDREGRLGLDFIRTQAGQYSKLLGIRQKDILVDSYIDMLQ